MQLSDPVAAGYLLAALHLVLALLFGWVADWMARGRLHRNGLIGIRIPATLRSEEAWLAGHRAAVVPMRVSAGLFAAAAVVMLAVAIAGGPAYLVGITSIVLICLVLAAVGWATLLAGHAASRR
jgi:hypothetical protein